MPFDSLCVLTIALAFAALTSTEIQAQQSVSTDAPWDTAAAWMPPSSLASLPAIPELPDLFTLVDGTKVVTADDWQRRRDELKAILLYYQYGQMPGRPDQVTVVEAERRPHESGLGTVESLTLQIDSVKQLRFRAVFYLPKHRGRRPVIIREEDRIGQRKDVSMFLEKGYLFVEYARHDLDPDRDRVIGTAQAAYPDHDWATLSVWAWCGMRLVDYLETRDDVDMDRIGITGHSRGGKMALLTAALDERIRLVVPHQSGSGGAGCYRVLGPGAETLAQNDKPHWYHERIRWFGEQEERLPFDQHFLKALVAPRALLCTESIDDEFANPLGSLATSVAAQSVFEMLGQPERNAIHYRRGGHSTETQDWARVLEFAEWQFFGRMPADASSYWPATFVLPIGDDSAKNKRQLAASNDDADAASNRQFAPPDALTTDVAMAEINKHFMTVGAPSNSADRELHGQGRYGAVTHRFDIAVTEVTHVEYARFLNSVATRSDPGQFYQARMASAAGAIRRVTTGSGFRYEVDAKESPRAVTYVSWYDAVRYCNWLHNGRPTGSQDATTTEAGAYVISSAGDVGSRRSDARYFLPREDEWYKAAYFEPTVDGGIYRHFAPQEVNRPILDKPCPEAISPWGMATYADKIWEWTESPVGVLHRSIRSAAWFLGNNKQSAGHFYSNPTIEHPSIGFRIARPHAD